MSTRFLVAAAIVVTCVAVSPARGQQVLGLTLPPGGNGRSPRAEVSEWIGPVKVTIGYYRPSVHAGPRDRTGHVFGELVPYGLFDDGHGPSKATPWRAGANENTTITVSHDVQIDHHEVKAGTYALFLEAQASGPWTWILSSHANGWGSYQYDPKNDVLHVETTPVEAPFRELLTYDFDHGRPDGATLALTWEQKRIPLVIDVPNVADLYVDEFRRDLDGWPGFDYRNWQTAAQFCADNKIHLDEALVWAEKAIQEPFRGAALGREDFSTLSTKASVLSAMGRTAEADSIMARALTLPATPSFLLYAYGMQLLRARKNEAAVAVFEQNATQHPDEPYWTVLGLARGYTATGDKAKAIKAWEAALAHLPEFDRDSLAQYGQILKGLKNPTVSRE